MCVAAPSPLFSPLPLCVRSVAHSRGLYLRSCIKRGIPVTRIRITITRERFPCRRERQLAHFKDARSKFLLRSSSRQSFVVISHDHKRAVSHECLVE